MCIAYIDPGNLEADLQTGVRTGYDLLWVLFWSTFLGFILQSLAAKLGVSTNRHLAQHCRDRYGTFMRILLWVMAELAIIGSDVQEVIGSSIALMILTNGAMPLWMGVVTGAVMAYLFLFLEKFGMRWLESFFQMMVGILGVCMAVIFFIAEVPYGKVLSGLMIPRLTMASLPTATGLLGAVIMPHNLFLHSALVHERGVPAQHRSTTRESLWYYRIESAFALMVTLGINTAVISIFSRGFHGKGHSASIGLQNAGEYLGQRFGPHMALVWAIGLLSAGQSSTMTGTYAGQFVMSGFLNLKMNPFKRALLTRAVSLIPALAVALSSSSSSSSLDVLNQWLNILQSVQLPFAIIPLLVLTADAAVVGLGFVNSFTTNVISWSTACIVIAINAGTAYQTALEVLPESVPIHALFWIFAALYAATLLALLWSSFKSFEGAPRVTEDNDQGGRPPLPPPSRLVVQEPSIRDSLLVVHEHEEMDQEPDEDVVKAAGTYVPPVSLPHRLLLAANITPRSVVSASSSRPVSSRLEGLSSHAINDVETSP